MSAVIANIFQHIGAFISYTNNNYFFKTNLFNFIIFAAIIIYICIKLNLKTKLEQAKENVDSVIHESETVMEESATKLDEMEKATTLVTTSKTPYSHAAYVFNVLNDISSYAFLQASEEMSNGKIFTEKLTEKDKKNFTKKDWEKLKRLERLEEEYNSEQWAIGLNHGKIVASEELDEIINTKFKECPTELFKTEDED